MKNKILFLIICLLQIIIIFAFAIFFYNHYSFLTALKLSDSTDTESEYIIDNDYIQKKQEIKSNADLTKLNDDFTLIWENKIDYYYQKLIDYFTIENNDDMIQTIQASKDNWEEYYLKEQDSYCKLISSAYGNGSIVPIILSNHNRTLCRFEAIELYKLCLNFLIEVEQL